MKRREFVALLGGAAFEWPYIARGQPPGKAVRIGWLSSSSYVGSPVWAAFIGEMQQRGWIEGATSLSSPYVGDPVASGLVASLARPGANLTGTGGLGTWTAAKLLELLKEFVTQASRVAVFVNSTIPLHIAFRADLEPTARSLGVTLRSVEVRSPDDLDGAFATMAADKIDALLILGQGMMLSERVRLARQALEHRLPAVVPFGEIVEAGVLMSYGPELIDDMRRLPGFVMQIVNGVKPADLPVEQPMRFYLTVNQKTANALGLTIPTSVLVRADEVIQ